MSGDVTFEFWVHSMGNGLVTCASSDNGCLLVRTDFLTG